MLRVISEKKELKPLQNPFLSYSYKCRPNFSFLQAFLVFDFEILLFDYGLFFKKTVAFHHLGLPADDFAFNPSQLPVYANLLRLCHRSDYQIRAFKRW